MKREYLAYLSLLCCILVSNKAFIFSTDPESIRVRSVIDGFYDQIEFPEDKDHFGDIAIYRRRA